MNCTPFVMHGSDEAKLRDELTGNTRTAAFAISILCGQRGPWFESTDEKVWCDKELSRHTAHTKWILTRRFVSRSLRDRYESHGEKKKFGYTIRGNDWGTRLVWNQKLRSHRLYEARLSRDLCFALTTSTNQTTIMVMNDIRLEAGERYETDITLKTCCGADFKLARKRKETSLCLIR